jgi:hypothetical protein
MDFILLVQKSGGLFDREPVADALKNIEGTYNHREVGDVASLYECQYDEADDSTIVRLAKDRKAIVISGSGEASISLALRLQSILRQPLLAIDSDYSFEVPLMGISSIEEFWEETANHEPGDG